MIKKLENPKEETLDRIMHIWLDSNIEAHDFIDKKYWYMKEEEVREVVSEAEIYCYEEDGIIGGFIGLEEDYIAGLFVIKEDRRKGIGRKLVDKVKETNDSLRLKVYKENNEAVQFYLNNNFYIADRETEDNTGLLEYIMEWNK